MLYIYGIFYSTFCLFPSRRGLSDIYNVFSYSLRFSVFVFHLRWKRGCCRRPRLIQCGSTLCLHDLVLFKNISVWVLISLPSLDPPQQSTYPHPFVLSLTKNKKSSYLKILGYVFEISEDFHNNIMFVVVFVVDVVVLALVPAIPIAVVVRILL